MIMNPQNKDAQKNVGKEVAAYDVLCGRRKAVLNHIGNRRYQVLVAMNLERYCESSNKQEKSEIIGSVIAAVQRCGGRFLQRCNNGGWEELPEKSIREKTGHSFRDMAQSRARNTPASATRSYSGNSDSSQNSESKSDQKNHSTSEPCIENFRKDESESSYEPMIEQQKDTPLSLTMRKGFSFHPVHQGGLDQTVLPIDTDHCPWEELADNSLREEIEHSFRHMAQSRVGIIKPSSTRLYSENFSDSLENFGSISNQKNQSTSERLIENFCEDESFCSDELMMEQQQDQLLRFSMSNDFSDQPVPQVGLDPCAAPPMLRMDTGNCSEDYRRNGSSGDGKRSDENVGLMKAQVMFQEQSLDEDAVSALMTLPML